MMGAFTAAYLGVCVMLGTAVGAVDVHALTKMIPDLLQPGHQGFVHQNGIALTAFALKFIQLEVLCQLEFFTSFVAFYCHD
jgi:hypothetical protein